MRSTILPVFLCLIVGCSGNSGIEGTVLNRDNSPVSGLTVLVRQKDPVEGYERSEGTTNEQGVFRFDSLFPDAEYEVSLEEGNEPASIPVTRTVRSGPAGHVRILSEPFVFSGPEGYQVTREIEAPFSFSLFGVLLNPGSSMERESIVFNEPSCPVEIAGRTLKIGFEDRRFRRRHAHDSEHGA